MIKGISNVRRCPRAGYIRLGIKVPVAGKAGVMRPKEVDYFVLDSKTGNPARDERLQEQFKKLYGDHPKRIKVMFPPTSPEIFFQQSMKRYGSGAMLKCKCVDGEIATCALPEYAEGLEAVGKNSMGMTQVKCPGPECIYQKKKECHRLANLQIILPELNSSSVWQINTSSFNSIVNMNSALDWLTGLCGRYDMIPIDLLRVPQDIAYEGKKSKHYVLQIDQDISIQYLQKAALISPQRSMITLPAADEKKDDLLYIDTNSAEENGEKEPEKAEEEQPLDKGELEKAGEEVSKEKNANGPTKATEAQHRQINAMGKAKGWSAGDIRSYAEEIFGMDMLDINKHQGEILFNYIKNNPKKK